ncbi:MAG: FAD-dependent oxidoreductase [Mucilaginibacter sp.]|uniref:FAD-dependent oxidoreductase n=1 Tax=Mucilaginibacter sp. TaxID=1882438 RepID=UPI003266EB00
MLKDDNKEKRSLRREDIHTDYAIVGGGLSGVCAAITAARMGLKVVLIQDRPVLGGNSSSEVRLWILGATSHMGNNNRWSREGGVIDEILVENTYKNKEGNPLLFDVILLDKVVGEPNITLLLNTAVNAVKKSNSETISSVSAFCSQNSVEYVVKAPLFCDASGDGIVGFLSGAAFRMGAESKEEFGEKFAPTAEYGELLGHSLYFYSKDTGKPVKFIPPDFALKNITAEIPRFKSFNAKEHGCKLWWLEYGGRLDTVHDTEKIKWELWKVVYGAWDYIKNSGKFPEADTMTLEWVGTIPGKRESRRFEGDYMLKQQDIIEQHTHHDAVAYGGWSIDLHPADGVFSEKPGCNQWHSKGIYQIPYRCLYSKNIKNLFLTGRIISASHVAFASTRVMATSAHVGQAVGMAAYMAAKNDLYPRDILKHNLIAQLQRELLKTGQHIPGLEYNDPNDLVQIAKLSASSEYQLNELSSDILKPVDISMAQMIPLNTGKVPQIIFHAESKSNTKLVVELRISGKHENYTPDISLEKHTLSIHPGRNCLQIDFTSIISRPSYAFFVVHKNPDVELHFSHQRVTGVLSVFNLVNKAVSNFGKQTPPEDIGVEEFEFWCPQRRPEGHNVAIKVEPALKTFKVSNIKTGIYRPTNQPNAWVALLSDAKPHIVLEWPDKKEISKIDVFFDADYDHPMETVLMGHPEDVMPFCVRNYQIKDGVGNLIYEKKDNYQSINRITFDQPVIVDKLTFFVEHPSKQIPAAIFAIRCYSFF